MLFVFPPETFAVAVGDYDRPLEWVDWFKSRRLLDPIGNIPPAEAAYYAQLKVAPIAA